ncbi:unnamed protein product [Alopecurus aequalis]
MLRRSILNRLLSSPSTSPVASLHRLLSAAAAALSHIPSFVVEDYLVDSCGLTRAQALKASGKISHLKSPSKPDAVLAFLAGLGLAGADVAAVVAKDPRLLCAKVEKTLAPIVVGLTGHGLSHSEIARLVSVVPASIRYRSVVSNLPYSGRSSALCVHVPRALHSKPERLRAMVACAEGLGVPRESEMFRHVLKAVEFRSEESIAAQVEFLKKTFSWSDAEVRIAVCKAPMMLMRSKETLQHRAEFLINEVGLEPAYIAHRPVMLMYSLEGRIRPRYYVLKFLKEKGLLHQDRDYYAVLLISNEVFMEKFICPHKEAAPHLAEDYAAACSSREVPTRFKFR